MELSVISWNIWRGKYLDKVIDFLKNNPADVIGLQEIIQYHKEPTQNSAEVIAKELGYNYFFCKAFTTDRHTPVYDIGNAFLSKYEFKNQQCHLLSTMEDYQNSSETEPRCAAEAIIDVNGQEIELLNVHLAYSHMLETSDLRIKQIKNLLPLIHAKYSILMGDYNALPANSEIQLLLEKLVSADSNPTQGTWSVFPRNYKGFEVQGPDYRIDNMYVTPDVSVKEFKILTSDASDHFPLYLSISL